MSNTPTALAPAETAPVAAPVFTPMSLQFSGEQKMALLDSWRAIAKQKWVILGLGMASLVVAGGIAFSLPAIFQSTATVMIEPVQAKVVNIEEVYGGMGQAREHFQTQVEILKSRDVALKTIKALKLWQHPDFDPTKAKESMTWQIKQSLGLGKPEPEWNEDTLAEAVLDKFQDALSVSPVRLSQLVKLSFESTSAELSQKVVSTHAEQYINSDREARFTLTQQASTWLQERVSGLRQKLDQSERALQAYRDSQGLVNLGGSAQSIDGQRISNVSTELVAARVRRAEIEGVYKDIRQIRSSGSNDFSSVAAVMRHPSVIKAKEQEAAAQQKLSELSQRYGYEHTKVVQATAELQSAKQSLNMQADSVAASLARDYEIARATEQQLAGELASARSSVAQVNRKEAQLGILEREVQANRQLYDLFMGRAKETSAANDMQGQVARVVDPAALGEQIKPKKIQMMAVALVLGLMAGALIALLLDKLDNTLKGQDDAEERLKQPILASLPVLKSNERKAVMQTVLKSGDNQFSEGVRTLRTGVLLSNLDQNNKIILVTSSVPGEGKSSVAANLAVALSATKNTLLIDADLRRPMVARGLALPPGVKGLANLCAGTAKVEECVHRMADTPLHVLPAGDIPPNPAELLLSKRFKSTLQALSAHYDIIVIDSPPIELVSDAMILAPQATATVYVTQAMSTPYPLVRKGLSRIERAGGTVLGVVLNQVDFEKAHKYYGQYAAYGKYGGYYGTANTQEAAS